MIRLSPEKPTVTNPLTRVDCVELGRRVSSSYSLFTLSLVYLHDLLIEYTIEQPFVDIVQFQLTDKSTVTVSLSTVFIEEISNLFPSIISRRILDNQSFNISFQHDRFRRFVGTKTNLPIPKVAFIFTNISDSSASVEIILFTKKALISRKCDNVLQKTLEWEL